MIRHLITDCILNQVDKDRVVIRNGSTEQFIYTPFHTPKVVSTDQDGDVIENRLTGLQLTEHRSLGWGVALLKDLVSTPGQIGCSPLGTGSNGLSATRGLIRLFEYHSYGPPDNRVHTNLLSAESVKEGMVGTPRRLSQNLYAENSEKLVGQSRFVLNSAGQSVPHAETTWRFTYHDVEEKKIKQVLMYRSPAAFPGQSGAGNTPIFLHPFEAQYFSEDGHA
ncbi:MAG: hypothetical protein K2Q20_01460 [Phycisphaerales bacterium]|nr:hypothetical protein [Phycisphaerales bacterium]